MIKRGVFAAQNSPSSAIGPRPSGEEIENALALHLLRESMKSFRQLNRGKPVVKPPAPTHKVEPTRKHCRNAATTRKKDYKFLGKMARPKRFELLTPRFVVWCSIQLSYGRGLSMRGGLYSRVARCARVQVGRRDRADSAAKRAFVAPCRTWAAIRSLFMRRIPRLVGLLMSGQPASRRRRTVTTRAKPPQSCERR